jgi:hypothetical protein
LPLDLLKAAVQDYIARDTPWPPSAGQLRNAAFDFLDSANGDRLSALQAWGEVVRKIGVDGHIRTPSFSSNDITAAVDAIGGWRYLCLSPEDALVSHRARFTAVYETLEKRRRDGQRMLPQVREVAERLRMGRVNDTPQLATIE